MKKTYIIAILALIALVSESQEIKKRTDKGSVYISKEPPKPPELSIIQASFKFTDEDGNNSIDVFEQAKILLEIENTGKGEGIDLTLKVSEKNGIKGLEFTKTNKLGNLQSGKKLSFEIAIRGKMELEEGEAAFVIKVDEANGMGADAVETPAIRTFAFKAPSVKVAQYQISKVDKSGSDQLRKKMRFYLEVRIENSGAGKAKNMTVELIKPENVNCYSGNIKTSYDDINFNPREQKIITYELAVTENYEGNSVPFKLIIKESYNKYGETKEIIININDKVSPVALPAIVYERPEAIKKTDDLLKDIPKGIADKNKIVVIIANGVYENGLPNIEVADNVLYTLTEYFINLYGLSKEEIFTRSNMTNDNLRVFFDKNADNSIINLLNKNKELIVYYIGHGGVNRQGQSFLCGKDSQGSGMLIDDLTKILNESEVKNYTLIVDACYSAAKGTMGEAIIEIKAPEPRGIYLASSKNNQVSNIYEEKNLTVFSYFFIKTLKELGNETNRTEIKIDDIYKRMLDPIKTFTLNKIKRIQEPEIKGEADFVIMRKK